jgi:hypothetical protein
MPLQKTKENIVSKWFIKHKPSTGPKPTIRAQCIYVHKYHLIQSMYTH